VGSQTKNIGSPSLKNDTRLPSGLPGFDVVGVWDDSRSRICFVWPCLAAELLQTEVDMDGLASFLYRPTVCGSHTWAQRFLIDIILSHHAAVGGDTFLGVWSPQDWIFTIVLTVWIYKGPNLTWRSLLLPMCTYPASELLWQLCIFLWWSNYVRQWWNRFQHSSTCCQERVNACVMSSLIVLGIKYRYFLRS
jgi:hypothetical protein